MYLQNLKKLKVEKFEYVDLDHDSIPNMTRSLSS